MSTYDRRLDRIEEAQTNGGPLTPSLWEVRAEIRRMESNPDYQSKWTQERVHHWINELEAKSESQNPRATPTRHR